MLLRRYRRTGESTNRTATQHGRHRAMASLNERIGDVVKRKRQRDRLTQADLGARIGVSGSYISGIEAAQTSPRISEIESLATVFRTTAFELISEAAKQDTYKFSDSNRERDAFLSLY